MCSLKVQVRNLDLVFSHNVEIRNLDSVCSLKVESHFLLTVSTVVGIPTLVLNIHFDVLIGVMRSFHI